MAGWEITGTRQKHFEALQLYIDMNFEGLRDDILSMLAGEEVPVNTGSFTNDMATFRTEDDVLTLLIHLGYLGYRYATKTVFIPNGEIRAEFVNAVSVSDWGEVSNALRTQQIRYRQSGRVGKNRLQREFDRRILRLHIFSIMMKCIELYDFSALYVGKKFLYVS